MSRPHPEAVAKAFHEAYERLAPRYGYQTRHESRVPWAEVPASNRALMIATAREVLIRLEDPPWVRGALLIVGLTGLSSFLGTLLAVQLFTV